MTIPDLPPIDNRPLWVFGYGSLIWNPGFPVAERRVATLRGWHRSFCMSSIHHRGTPENPGLVLALDAADGAECHGVAFRVRDGAEDATVTALRERELISSAYLERLLTVEIDGTPVTALSYVIDPAHVQYRGGLPLEDQARIIAAATGGRGPNDEYLDNTARHLAELGLPDPDLDWLSERVRALKAS
ncbi:gamma-glutamylcyclotransferase [Rhodobacterales bacterium HKCCE2091]|nr:gamma-glutamylcyclotransferase [Rhodobacterales bacterium HKCCE2091]